MTIRVSHTFLLFFWGVWEAKPPRKFWRIFRLIFNIFVSVKSFFCFFRGVWGRSPQKIFEIFQFSDAGGGATENFFWLFPDFLMSEKNRWGGGVRRKFFSDVIFLRPLNKTLLTFSLKFYENFKIILQHILKLFRTHYPRKKIPDFDLQDFEIFLSWKSALFTNFPKSSNLICL